MESLSTDTFATALAHAGPHELSSPGTLLHALTSPDHLAAFTLVVAACYAGYWVGHRRAAKKSKAGAAAGEPRPLAPLGPKP